MVFREIGFSDLPGDATGHAFLWQRGVMTDLGTLPGDSWSAAYAINDEGQVTGQSQRDYFRVFRRSAPEVVDSLCGES